jgi:hypothetical protein
MNGASLKDSWVQIWCVSTQLLSRSASLELRPRHSSATGSQAAHYTFNSGSRHVLREDVAVRANAVLGGLHHEYFLAPTVASPSVADDSASEMD